MKTALPPSITVYKGLSRQAQQTALPTLGELYSSQGEFGAGVYFANQDTAQVYADAGDPMLLCAEISTAHMLHIEVSNADAFDLDTYALPLLQRLFSLTAEQAADFYRANHVDGFFLGECVREKAMSLGFNALLLDFGQGAYDCLVLRYDAVKEFGEVEFRRAA